MVCETMRTCQCELQHEVKQSNGRQEVQGRTKQGTQHQNDRRAIGKGHMGKET